MIESAEEPRASVVVGFKDWGLERLELSLRTVSESLAGTTHEIIVADYGSTDGAAVAAVAARAGAGHERVWTRGEWSRSRALNAGVRVARGEIILATDADMLFSPGTLDRVIEQLGRNPQEIVILQCRDLPTGHSHETASREGLDWEHFAAVGHLRPRWGMGGLIGIRRNLWDRLRGWDERMHTYGGEDIDFAQRAQRLGARIDWLDAPGVAMYHVWHPSSGASAARSRDASAAVAENRRIRDRDLTAVRNRTRARYLPGGLPPLVSVVVEAPEESEALDRTLLCVLGQSILDVEVIVDGPIDIAPWGPQVRYSDGTGARPEGTFTAVARAGEIWADDHLESLLSAWTPGTGLLTSGTAELQLTPDGRILADPTVSPGDAPSSRATIVRTSLLPSGAGLDAYGWSAALRAVVASGADWKVLPEARHVVIATAEDTEHLRDESADDAVLLAGVLSRCGLPLPTVPDAQTVDLGIRASAVLSGDDICLKVDLADAADVEQAKTLAAGTGSGDGFGSDLDTGPGTWRTSIVRTRNGEVLRSEREWTGRDLRFAVRVKRELEALGAAVSLSLQSSSPAASLAGADPVTLVRAFEAEDGPKAPDGSVSLWIAAAATPEGFGPTRGTLDASPQVELVIDRVVESQGEEITWVLARLQIASLADAWTTAASVTTAKVVSVIELHEQDEQDEQDERTEEAQ